MTHRAEYDKLELQRRIENKAFQFTFYLSLSAIFLWVVWLIFDYYQAQEIFLVLLVLRLLLSLGAGIVAVLMIFKKIDARNAQFFLYIPALTFLGFLYNYSPSEMVFNYVLSGVFMVIVAGFIFFIMPPLRSILYGAYGVFIIILLNLVFQKHSLLDILLNGGVLFISMVAFTVAYSSVRYRSVEKGYIYELIIESTNKMLAEQQESLRKKNIELEQSLTEKEFLLKEIHHRVKNNLQIVSSLLNLQNVNKSGKSVQDVLMSSQNRINAMAILHEILYKSDNMRDVKLKEFISMLTTQLYSTHELEESNIKISHQIFDYSIDVDKLIPLGLIINELVTNCVKYAFQDQNKGEIRIEFIKNAGVCTLRVSDNGIGLPPNFETISKDRLGVRLVYGLANQLNAQVAINNEINGTSVVIEFNEC